MKNSVQLMQIFHHYLQVNRVPLRLTILFIFLKLNTANPFNER